jgi:hypothetical protein
LGWLWVGFGGGVGFGLARLGHWPMYRWRISIFGEKKTIRLRAITAPDEASARQKAIEVYSIPASQQFRVVAVKIEVAKKPAKD